MRCSRTKLIAYTAVKLTFCPWGLIAEDEEKCFALAYKVDTNVDSIVVFTEERAAGGTKSKQQPHQPYRPNGQRDLS